MQSPQKKEIKAMVGESVTSDEVKLTLEVVESSKIKKRNYRHKIDKF